MFIDLCVFEWKQCAEDSKKNKIWKTLATKSYLLNTLYLSNLYHTLSTMYNKLNEFALLSFACLPFLQNARN